MSGDQLDTSELLRVFGCISGQVNTPVDMPTGQPETRGWTGVLLTYWKPRSGTYGRTGNQTAQLTEMLKA